MIKIKSFSRDFLIDLEKAINKFAYDHKIINVSLSSTIDSAGYHAYYRFFALVTYEEEDE